MKNTHLAFAVALAIGWFNANHARASMIYNAAADWSAANNPTGAWSYGWSTSLASAFNLDSNPFVINGLTAWDDASHQVGLTPNVNHNGTAGVISFSNTVFLPGQLTLHPGSAGEKSIVRWTAPASGSMDINAVFAGRALNPTTTDIHVLHNSVSLFDGLVNNFNVGHPFSTTSIGVAMGDTIDFKVGFGSNNNFNGDTTSLDAVITFNAIPEPNTLTLAMLGILGLIGCGRRRLFRFRT